MIDRVLPKINLSEDLYLRLALLVAQSFSLGATLSLLIISANSLFLTDFGSQFLPYVYIAVAFAGSLISYGFTALLRRWALPKLTLSTIACLMIFYLVGWVGLALAQMRWISFALIVSFSVVIQIGFILLGAQAGRLLDLRQIKRLFSQIVAGFVIGFMAGAMLVPSFISLLGSTENVLLAVVVSTLIWLVFVWITSRCFAADLSRVEISRQVKPSKPISQLVKNRYVLLLAIYLMLASIVNQLSDFILLTQVGARFTTTQDLAQFFSRFTVGLNLTDLLFTMLIAGFFLSRVGLRGGLLANPLAMGLLFLFSAIVAPSFGVTSGLFFALVVVGRVANITLTDGTTRASTNAAYQALPGQERVPVQTGVEGIGVPIALGLVGVILLIFNAIPSLTLFHIVLLTLFICLAWIVTSLRVYREYKASLFTIIRRQSFDEADINLEDGYTMEVIHNLIQSDRLYQVKLALNMLQKAEHPSLDNHLKYLLTHASAQIRAESLSRIEQRRVVAAQEMVENVLKTDTDSLVTGAALRALCALKEYDAIDQVIPFLNDERPEVLQGALVGLLRYGGIDGILIAGQYISLREESPDPKERIFIARVIGEVENRSFYQPLTSLMQDQDKDVRQAALMAAGRVRHPRLLDSIIRSLEPPVTRSVAVSALENYGDEILAVVQPALEGDKDYGKVATLRLVRICGKIRGEKIVNLLEEHISHPDHEIRHQVLAALNLSNYRPDQPHLEFIEQALEREVDLGVRILVIQNDLGEADVFEPLQRALVDEFILVLRRIFLLLSFQYDAQVILQAGDRLISANESEKALALEVLEVTLSPVQKVLVFSLVDPQRSLTQRIQQMSKFYPTTRKPVEDWLKEIISDPEAIWQINWTKACAIYAVGKMISRQCLVDVKAALSLPDPLIQETAQWALNRLDLS